jgi:hypothetical protein
MVNELLVNLVNSVLGAGKRTARGNQSYTCPFCHHHKPKLEVNFTENKDGINQWACWTCSKKGKSIPWLNNGDKRTEEHKKNLSNSLKGRISPNKGKKFDLEFRKKLSKSSTVKRKVKQMDMNGNVIKIWDSISLAQNTLQIRHISEVCRGVNYCKTSGGYRWEYHN